MSQDFSGKRIVITGSATGIGQATARLLSDRGASLALWDIDEGGCRKTASSLGTSQKVIPIGVDVGDRASVAEAMSLSVQELGGIDGAFNNAGIGLPTVPIDMVEEEDFDRIIRINLKGVWLCMKAQLPHLRESGGGSIVNTASVAGLVGLAMQGPYSGTKHGVIGISKVAALENAESNIRVNALCPGATHTPILGHLLEAGITEEMLSEMSAQKRLANSSEIAEAACWLLSDQSSFVTGTAVPVDGGWTAH